MDALNPIRPEDLGPILLLVNNIEVVYHDVIQVLRGVSLKVPEGRITALLGPNGAGKTTTLRAISGLLIPEDGEVVRGEILFRGTPIQGRPPEEIVKLGIVQKSGAWFNYGDIRLGQGRDNAKQFLKDNPEIANDIEGQIRANADKLYATRRPAGRAAAAAEKPADFNA